MATEIVMPNLGFDAQSAVILEWYKKVGDAVSKGEVIALIEADKSNVELQSIASGTLIDILVPVDQSVEVGTVIARVGEATTEQEKEAVRISPIAQKVATEKGVNINSLTGSGTRGRILRRDVESYTDTNDIPVMALPKVRKAAREAGINLSDLNIRGRPITLADLQQQTVSKDDEISVKPVNTQPSPRAVPVRTGGTAEPLSRIRQRISQRLVQSKQSAPHFYVTGEFDLTDAIGKLVNYRAKVNDLLQYLTVQTLLQVPTLNGQFDGENVYQYDNVHLAIAVALDTGLVTPVIPEAELYSLNGLAQRSRELIKRTRDGQSTAQDMQSGTFTISNLGVIPQVDHFTAIINPPQLAILAVGSVKARPVVLNGGLHIRETVHLTLSGDHRVVDGIDLGHFMQAYQAQLDEFSR